jgi:hypothetical protein
MCSDWKTSSVLGTAQSYYKTRVIGRGWHCITAGTQTDIEALLRFYKNHLEQLTVQIDETNVKAVMREPLILRKREKANEYTIGKFGVSYDFNLGKDKLPPDVFRDATLEISRISLAAEFILAGFIDELPWILETTKECELLIRDDFATVGEGSYLARTALLHRQQAENLSLTTTLYNVYEAKKYAQRISSVGEETALSVLHKTGDRSVVRAEARRQLEEHYKKFGPQPTPEKVPITGDLYSVNRGGGSLEEQPV